MVRSHRLVTLPLSLRRVGAWAIEITIVAASAIVPLELGLVAKTHHTGELAPLNPVLSATEEAIAETLAIPIGDENQQVAPLTNLLWSGAIVLPIVLAGSQLYLLAKTGSTLPKRWFGIQVTTATGTPPGLAKVLLREGVGRWGLPVGTAYLIWRYSGAFPGLGILASLSALLLVGEAAIALFDRDRRTGHDRIGGTYAIDAFSPIWQPVEPPLQAVVTETADDWVDGAITAIVLPPEPLPRQQGLWLWMRHHPGTVLVGGSIATVGLVLGTFVGTLLYIQGQANDREIRQQRDQMFLAIVNQLATSDRLSERQAAVLTLASIDDPRSPALLSDLLAQETSSTMLDAIEQALVSLGTETLPALRKLNQAMRSEFASAQGTSQARLAALRLRTTQQAIAKILTIYSGQLPRLDLSRIDLGQTNQPAFRLVLDQTDLSSLNFRSARLAGVSLRGTRFYGRGKDDRWGTFDDAIADLSGAELKQTDLTGAILSRVRLDRTNFTNATLNKADLSHARSIAGNFSNASLVGGNLQQAVLERASFTGANLGNANFSQVNLQAGMISQAQAIATNFTRANLRQSDWREADLSRSNFTEANLDNADLSAANLQNANFTNANLQNANLTGADLNGVNFSGANLDGADFQDAIFVPAPPVRSNQFIQTDPQYEVTAALKGVDFTRVRNLSREQVEYICVQGGIYPRCPAP
ncbi:pentapeptide repeat-containing protein [Microcoleus sp. FACHB-1515]|uniref:pentapeptide repeat-containing protein n=1 Tax=Cyanophyceae TaxID=3028117 RepID=UPI001F5592F8|nr:pentapeptide repeat-containing protein [Microcoleus sp. FACHB-1515]